MGAEAGAGKTVVLLTTVIAETLISQQLPDILQKTLHFPCSRSSKIEDMRWHIIGNAFFILLRDLHWNPRGQKDPDCTFLDNYFSVLARLHQKMLFPNGCLCFFAGNVTFPGWFFSGRAEETQKSIYFTRFSMFSPRIF